MIEVTDQCVMCDRIEMRGHPHRITRILELDNCACNGRPERGSSEITGRCASGDENRGGRALLRTVEEHESERFLVPGTCYVHPPKPSCVGSVSCAPHLSPASMLPYSHASLEIAVSLWHHSSNTEAE